MKQMILKKVAKMNNEKKVNLKIKTMKRTTGNMNDVSFFIHNIHIVQHFLPFSRQPNKLSVVWTRRNRRRTSEVCFLLMNVLIDDCTIKISLMVQSCY